MAVVVTQNGDVVTIPLTVTNNGSQAATNVQTPIVAPAGLDYFSVVAGSGSYTAGVWTIPNLPVSATALLTIKAQVTDISQADWTLTFTSTAAENDSILANNTVEIIVVDCSAYQTCIDALEIGDTNFFSTDLVQDEARLHDAGSQNTVINNVGSFIFDRGAGTLDNYFRISIGGVGAHWESGATTHDSIVTTNRAELKSAEGDRVYSIKTTTSGVNRAEIIAYDNITSEESYTVVDLGTGVQIGATNNIETSQVIAYLDGRVRLDSSTDQYILGNTLGGNLPPDQVAPTHFLTLNTITGAIEKSTVAIGDKNYLNDDLIQDADRNHDSAGFTIIHDNINEWQMLAPGTGLAVFDINSVGEIGFITTDVAGAVTSTDHEAQIKMYSDGDIRLFSWFNISGSDLDVRRVVFEQIADDLVSLRQTSRGFSKFEEDQYMLAAPYETLYLGENLGANAVAWLHMPTNPGNGQTVTIDGKVYTFETVLTNVDGHVLIGINDAASTNNLIAAIVLGAGSGTLYAAATTLHSTVSAALSNGLKITANAAGVAGEGLAVSTNVTDATWVLYSTTTPDPATNPGGVDESIYATESTKLFFGGIDVNDNIEYFLVRDHAGDGQVHMRTFASLSSAISSSLTKELTINEYEVAENVAAAAQGQTLITIPLSMNGLILSDVTAAIHTLGAATGAQTIDVNVVRRRAGANVNMMSVPVTLLDTEYFNNNGTIDGANDDIATGDVLSVSVVNGFDTTDATGLAVTLTFIVT